MVARQSNVATAPTMTPTILVFDSGLGGLTVYREVDQGAARRALRLRRGRRVLPLWPPARSRSGRTRARRDGELIEAHRPDLVVVACNTASTLVLPQLARAFHSAVRRHRAGDQAGLRGLEEPAGFRARHRGDRPARIHPRADPRFRRRLRGHAGRLAAARRTRRSGAAAASRRPTPTSRQRSPPASSSRTAQRTDTIVLACTHYPLLLDRLQSAGALAGGFHRSGAGDRAAGGRTAGRPHRRAATARHALRFHLRTGPVARACRPRWRALASPKPPRRRLT